MYCIPVLIILYINVLDNYACKINARRWIKFAFLRHILYCCKRYSTERECLLVSHHLLNGPEADVLCLHVCWHIRLRFLIASTVVQDRQGEDLTLFVARTKKCRNFHSIVSLRSQFEIHNTNKSFSLLSQSQTVGCVKKSLIITAKHPEL